MSADICDLGGEIVHTWELLTYTQKDLYIKAHGNGCSYVPIKLLQKQAGVMATVGQPLP